MSGNIHKGDQIMMCEGEKLVDVPLEKAEEVFKKHMLEPLDVSLSVQSFSPLSPALFLSYFSLI